MSKRHNEMAEAIDRAEAEDEIEEQTRTYARPAPPRRPSQVYTVRVPVERLEMLRQVAAARQENPSTLMREWVLERLDSEIAGRPAIDQTLEALARDLAELRRRVEDLANRGGSGPSRSRSKAASQRTKSSSNRKTKTATPAKGRVDGGKRRAS